MNYSYLVLFLVVLSAIIMGMSIALYIEYQDETKNNLNNNLLVLMSISIILFVFELIKYLYLKLRNIFNSSNVKNKKDEGTYNGMAITRISGKYDEKYVNINDMGIFRVVMFSSIKTFFGISEEKDKALTYSPFPAFMTCGLIFTLMAFSVIIYKDNNISDQPLNFLITIISLVSIMALLSLIEIITSIGYIFIILFLFMEKIHNLIVR